MEIRRARDEDYVGMANLRQSTIRKVNSRDYPEHIIDRWSSTISAEDFLETASQCRRWVAMENDELAGFCEHNFSCEISRVYVHMDHLRKGVGSRLVTAAEHSLKESGCKQIRVESTVTAKEFYEIHGYEVIGSATYDGDKNVPVYVMSKRIAE